MIPLFGKPYECLEAQLSAKLAVKQLQCELAIQSAGELKGELSATSKRAMELASEKGASNSLVDLPTHRGVWVLSAQGCI